MEGFLELRPVEGGESRPLEISAPMGAKKTKFEGWLLQVNAVRNSIVLCVFHDPRSISSRSNEVKRSQICQIGSGSRYFRISLEVSYPLSGIQLLIAFLTS